MRAPKKEKSDSGQAPGPVIGQTRFQRWNIHHRLQHILLFSSFLVLTITGLPIKYSATGWGKFLTMVFGGFDTMFAIHLAGAVVMIISCVYHLGYVVWYAVSKRDFTIATLPRWKDITDLFQHVKYCLGMSEEDAKFDRYSYKEKFDYLAIFWGIPVMVGSGLIMWFPHLAGKVVPRWFMDAAQVAHSDEAILAISAIFIWHFYNTHFNPKVWPMSTVWLNGNISQAEMQEYHPEELKREIDRGGIPEPVAKPEQPTVHRPTSRAFVLFQMLFYLAVLIAFLWMFLPIALL